MSTCADTLSYVALLTWPALKGCFDMVTSPGMMGCFESATCEVMITCFDLMTCHLEHKDVRWYDVVTRRDAVSLERVLGWRGALTC